MADVEIDGCLKLRAIGADLDVAQPRLTGIDADSGGRLRHRKAGSVERAGDEIADAATLGRNAKLDGAGHRAEHTRVEPDKPRLLRRLTGEEDTLTASSRTYGEALPEGLVLAGAAQ